ncbi:DUF1501 domain-containing protein [Calycomorphotria hydatis]|uniref:DUF1501 domain-containing protein n=1 Tax=Calycomorphotria hydatis TaxID=2528027 RepID=A0A517TB56_9PLAN|nr:DUF1501 domain-containing protein [Calycomorphotria hydatis]QDT65604.1 hypothetical protein V22_28610 [Calycomorphotria hydatis]
MLTFTGRGEIHTCNGRTRRDFLQVGALGAIGLTLPDLLAAQAQGAVTSDNDDKACIMIFNLGAPSHVDLFDMKPDAPAEVRGPFKPIDTAADAIQISEVLPEHAKIADKFSLVRSAHHKGAAVHDSGWQMLQTGRMFSGGVNTPHAGSVVSYLKGRKTDLPPFVVLPELMGRGGGNLPNGQAGGFLGKAYDPFALNANPAEENFQVPDLLPPKEIGSVRLDRRRKLRDIVDQTVQVFEATENAALLDSNFESAFRLMTSKQAREAFDLSKESTKVRERYGMNRFGQCCLLARRLIDAGVRFVTINTFLTVFNEVTWDIHGSKPFTSIEGMKNIVCPMYDKGYSALIEDLDQRGMLDSTMVCNLAEFGRTPRVNPAGGRDHWPQCFSVYFAGGGVKGGQVVGASDPIGGVPADRPVEPGDVVATIFKSLGLDITSTLPGPAGRPFPLVDFGHDAIHELF